MSKLIPRKTQVDEKEKQQNFHFIYFWQDKEEGIYARIKKNVYLKSREKLNNVPPKHILRTQLRGRKYILFSL